MYPSVAIFRTLRREHGRPPVPMTAEGRWTVEKAAGALTVRADTGATVAMWVAGKGGEGTATLADGHRLRWDPTTKGQAEWAAHDDAGRHPVRFWDGGRWLTAEHRGEACRCSAWSVFDVGKVLALAFATLV